MEKLSSADEMDKISRGFADAIGGMKNSAIIQSEPGKSYFGEISRHPSLYRESYTTPISHNDPLSFTSTIGALHEILRVKFPQMLGVKLDTDNLQPETRKLLSDLKGFAAAYRQEVKNAEEENPGGLASCSKIPGERIGYFNGEAASYIDALNQSELSKAETIPVKINRTPLRILNNNNLGLFLFALPQASSHLTDYNQIQPWLAVRLIERITGQAIDIIKTMRKHFADEPLRAQYERACEQACTQMLEVVRKGARGLQMANLVSGEDMMDYKPPAAALLDLAGLPSYPDHLTPRECAVAIQALNVENSPEKNEIKKQLIQECLAMAQDPSKKLSAAAVNVMTRILDNMRIYQEETHKETYRSIVKEFLTSYCQQSQRDSSKPWARPRTPPSDPFVR